MTSTDALANSPKTFRERDDWCRAALASDLPHVAVRLAVRIALHLNVTTGRCDPTYTTLATGSGIAERSVYRLIALLERSGWIAILRTRGRHANQYVLLNPAKAGTGFNPARAMTGLNTANPVTSDNPTLSNTSTNPANMVADKKRLTAKRKKKGKERASRARAESPGVASRGEKKKGTVEVDRAAIDDGFARFMSVYPRKENEDDARAAFVKAIEAGADIEAVIARAAGYAVERADAISNGDLPKWTLYPATWLKKRKWNDPLPAGAVIDQQGNIVAFEQPPSQQRQQQRGIAAIGEEMAQEIERKGGGW